MNEWSPIKVDLQDSDVEIVEEDKIEEVEIGRSDVEEQWLRIKTILHTIWSTR